MTNPDSMDDAELLRRFAAERSEASFAVLARRHTGLVLDTALRFTGSRPLAEEIMQTVFLQLARKAASVASSRAVTAWLHRAVVLESRAVLRAESRRHKYTTEAAAMADVSFTAPPDPDPRMTQLLRSLDEALGSLPAVEREVLLRHYYERQPYHEAGQWLGTSEAGARQLAARARKRLAAWFRRRHGMEISIPGISTLLGGHFPSDPCSSNGSLAQIAVQAAAAKVEAPSIINLFKNLHFISVMKMPVACCLLMGFLLTLSLGIGRERETQTAVAAAPIGNPPRLPAASGRHRPGREAARLTEGFDLTKFEMEMASVARLSKDRRLGFWVGSTNAWGSTPSFDFSYGLQLQLARLVMHQPISQMPALLEACKRGDPEAKGQFVLQALFARWAEGDPADARSHLEGLPRKAQEYAIRGMCATMLNRDVGATARMALSLPDKIREGLYDGSRRGFINNIISICASHNPQAAFQACLDAPEHLAGESVDRVMQSWRQEDPDAAINFFVTTSASREIPGKGRVERQSVRMLKNSHPELAAKVVNSLPAGALRDSLADELNGTTTGAQTGKN